MRREPRGPSALAVCMRKCCPRKVTAKSKPPENPSPVAEDLDLEKGCVRGGR